ncbi:MAG: CoA pyrophosphatase [Desulfobacteraceae bacterium]|jgi:hypothetical protein|nr:CoA pyrophosphatase [Desulfobacteraceae bacterium]
MNAELRDSTRLQTQLLEDRSRLLHHITDCLGDRRIQDKIFSNREIEWQTSAGVVMLLGPKPSCADGGAEPCVVLNKRSLKVKQSGDLCFPGGSIAPRIDPYLARLFSLPFTSLGRWPYWQNWQQSHTRLAKTMSILWATGLRESFEEMRLNPFGVRFLGPLPPQSLVMFKRTIYPMVGWINRQKRFFPNWEVAEVVYVPLRNLLNPAYYSRYRLTMGTSPGQGQTESIQDFPCFRIETQNKPEILWGATYRITLDFLEHVFGFKPPAITTLPVVEGVLDESYLAVQK